MSAKEMRSAVFEPSVKRVSTAVRSSVSGLNQAILILIMRYAPVLASFSNARRLFVQRHEPARHLRHDRINSVLTFRRELASCHSNVAPDRRRCSRLRRQGRTIARFVRAPHRNLCPPQSARPAEPASCAHAPSGATCRADGRYRQMTAPRPATGETLLAVVQASPP